jgi:hypothetical protein
MFKRRHVISVNNYIDAVCSMVESQYFTYVQGRSFKVWNNNFAYSEYWRSYRHLMLLR